jgi:hypothetical protein
MSKLPGSFRHKPGQRTLTIITTDATAMIDRATLVMARTVHPQKWWITLGIMGSRNRQRVPSGVR